MSSIKLAFGLNTLQLVSNFSFAVLLTNRYGAENLDSYYYLITIGTVIYANPVNIFYSLVVSKKRNRLVETSILIVFFLFYLIGIYISSIILKLPQVEIFWNVLAIVFFRGSYNFLIGILKLQDLKKYTFIDFFFYLTPLTLFLLPSKSLALFTREYFILYSFFFIYTLLQYFRLEQKSEITKFKEYFIGFWKLYFSTIPGNIYALLEKNFLIGLDQGILTTFVLAQKIINPFTSLISGSTNLVVIFKNVSGKGKKIIRSILDLNLFVALFFSIVITYCAVIIANSETISSLIIKMFALNQELLDVFLKVVLFSVIILPVSAAYTVLKKYFIASGEIPVVQKTNYINSLSQILLISIIPIFDYNLVLITLLSSSILTVAYAFIKFEQESINLIRSSYILLLIYILGILITKNENVLLIYISILLPFILLGFYSLYKNKELHEI